MQATVRKGHNSMDTPACRILHIPFQNDRANVVQTIGGCTCSGVEVKDGVVYVKHHHLLALAGWIQHLDLRTLYPLSEPLLQDTFLGNRDRAGGGCSTNVQHQAGQARLLTWYSGLSLTSMVCSVSSAMSKSSWMCGAISAWASSCAVSSSGVL